MECPYCKKEMKEGCIPYTNSHVFWQGPYDRESFSSERVPLQKYDLLKAEDAPAHYCPDCRIVIVPVPEFEPPMEKFSRKLDEWADKAWTRQEDFQARRKEEKKKKKREANRKKDPWEID